MPQADHYDGKCKFHLYLSSRQQRCFTKDYPTRYFIKKMIGVSGEPLHTLSPVAYKMFQGYIQSRKKSAKSTHDNCSKRTLKRFHFFMKMSESVKESQFEKSMFSQYEDDDTGKHTILQQTLSNSPQNLLD